MVYYGKTPALQTTVDKIPLCDLKGAISIGHTGPSKGELPAVIVLMPPPAIFGFTLTPAEARNLIEGLQLALGHIDPQSN